MLLPFSLSASFDLAQARMPARRHGGRLRPMLEQLENRLCPTSTTVNIANGAIIPYSVTAGEKVQVIANVTSSDPGEPSTDGANLIVATSPEQFILFNIGSTTANYIVGSDFLVGGAPLTGNMTIQTTDGDETGTMTFVAPTGSSSDTTSFANVGPFVAGVPGPQGTDLTVTVKNAQTGANDSAFNGQTMTLTLKDASGATLPLTGGTATISGATASFGNLTISNAGTGDTLTAEIGDLVLGTSPPFDVQPRFIPNGGPVLNNVTVENVFFGSGWRGETGTMVKLNGFQQFITGSTYMNLLTEYHAGPNGSLLGNAMVPGNAAGRPVTDNEIQHMLTTAIAHHDVPPPGPSMLYFVYTPRNVAVTDKEGADQNFLGYHNSFKLGGTGPEVYYAVVPHPGGTNPTIHGLTPFQATTSVSSHELAEAVTDPSRSSSGWESFTLPFQEIADVCINEPPVYLNHYAVEELWSNQVGSCVAPAGFTLSP
jgi:hypothetical protein